MQHSLLRLTTSLLAQQKTSFFKKGQLAASSVANRKLSTTPAVHDGDRKLYELRTYSIRPDCFGEFLKLSDENMHMRMEHSKLIGYWRTELGGINEVVHIWEYDNFSHRAAVRQALAQDPEWVGKYFSKILPMMVKQDNVVMHLMPWSEQGVPSKTGGVYELRSYLMTADQQWQDPLMRAVLATEKAKVVPCELLGAYQSEFGEFNRGVYELRSYLMTADQQWQDPLRRAILAIATEKAKVIPCELLGVYQSEFGEFNRVYQLWFNDGFQAFDARQEARKKVIEHPEIIAAGMELVPFVQKMDIKALLPVGFSPMQ